VASVGLCGRVGQIDRPSAEIDRSTAATLSTFSSDDEQQPPAAMARAEQIAARNR
jgi:hypothetical protein